MSDDTKGIDIRKALEILSMRESSAHDSCHHHVPQEAVQWGQRVYLPGNSSSSSGSSSRENINRGDDDELKEQLMNEDTSLEDQRKRRENERAKRSAEMQAKLQSMNVKELLKYLLNTQQQRVATYRIYERGLDEVLNTGNLTNYPKVCAEVTAAFSVLSETILCVHKVLKSQPHHRDDLCKLIRRLQNHEKEKLNLTAALHLERIRAKNADIDKGEECSTIAKLLQLSVSSLHFKLSTCVGEINEALEELRLELIEAE